MGRAIRTLLFSTLFPSSARPLHGIFVETRLRELLRSGRVETKVVAPVPWFPSTDDRYGEYAKIAATPARESLNGIDVLHPRYPAIPKVGMTMAPLLLAAASVRTVKRLVADGFDFDVVDAHYFYPDGVAAMMLARYFDKPVCITARGTDLNLIPRYTLPRKMMQWAARNADASIGVCSALVDVFRAWGIEESRLHVMRNGVDLERFRPMPREQARLEVGIHSSPLILSVGHLVERKGHHLAIEAVHELRHRYPTLQLVILGEGEERARLQQQANALGLGTRVRLAGAVPNERLAHWYSAADLLVLASSREGWANVLLESMACGTPVVATSIWGTPEVVNDQVGCLVEVRDGAGIAAAATRVLDAAHSPIAIRAYAESFGWDQTSRSQLELLTRLAVARGHPGLVDCPPAALSAEGPGAHTPKVQENCLTRG
jgi:teichuronic acid biosynthesis glycosyltransferase TuaC